MNVLVWGTGSAASQVDRIAEHNSFDIVGYVDGNSSCSSHFRGKPVIAPGEISLVPHDFLVIASAFHEEIKKVLRKLYHGGNVLVHSSGYESDDSIERYFELPFDLKRWNVLQHAIVAPCNMTCRHCPNVVSVRRSEVHADSAKRDRYLAMLSKFDPAKFNRLLISDGGEVTLLPDFMDYVDGALSQGWRNLQFVTNGTCDDINILSSLFSRDCFSEILISVESAEPSIYSSIRGYPLRSFKSFMETISTARASSKSRTKLYFNVTCMDYNFDSLDGIVEMASEYDIDKVIYVPIHALRVDQTKGKKLCTQEQTLSTIAPERRAAVYRAILDKSSKCGVEVQLPEEIPETCVPAESASRRPASPMPSAPVRTPAVFRCPILYNFVQIGVDGDVYPCCQMRRARSMGSALSHDFRSIWDGAEYVQLRRSLRRDQTPLSICTNCTILQGCRW